MTHMDVFNAIASTYPVERLNDTSNLPKIQYLCCAGKEIVHHIDGVNGTLSETSSSIIDNTISVHLTFTKKVNFKHKFIDHIFPGKCQQMSYSYIIIHC